MRKHRFCLLRLVFVPHNRRFARAMATVFVIGGMLVTADAASATPIPFAKVFVNAITGGSNEFHTVISIPNQESVSSAATAFDFRGFPVATATGSASLGGTLGALVTSTRANANAIADVNVTFHVIAGDPQAPCDISRCRSGDTLTITLSGGPVTGSGGGSASAFGLTNDLVVDEGEPGGINTADPNHPDSATFNLLVGEYDIEIDLSLAAIGIGSADFSHTLSFAVNVPVGGLFTETSGLVPVHFAADVAPPAAVPEPSTIFLLSVGLPMLARRAARRRTR